MKKYKYDVILLIVLLCIGITIILCVRIFSKPGAFAEVRLDGALLETIELDEDGSYLIETVGGNNLLKVEAGKLYMHDADCPDKLCMHMGEIEKCGQSIVCLPHRLVVEIVSGKNAEIDAVAK